MHMVSIEVSCHYNFVTFERSLSKLHSNLMSKCRLNIIAARVRLNEVIVANAASLAIHFTSIFEFLIGSWQRTVESCHELFALSLVIAADVPEASLATAAVLSAYRCDRRHYFTSRSS